MTEVRCRALARRDRPLLRCNRLLGRIAGRYDIKCPSCGTINRGDTETRTTKGAIVDVIV